MRRESCNNREGKGQKRRKGRQWCLKKKLKIEGKATFIEDIISLKVKYCSVFKENFRFLLTETAAENTLILSAILKA